MNRKDDTMEACLGLECGGCDLCWDCYAQCEECGEDMTEDEAHPFYAASGLTYWYCGDCID